MKRKDLQNFTKPCNVQQNLKETVEKERKSTSRPNIKQSEQHIGFANQST